MKVTLKWKCEIFFSLTFSHSGRSSLRSSTEDDEREWSRNSSLGATRYTVLVMGATEVGKTTLTSQFVSSSDVGTSYTTNQSLGKTKRVLNTHWGKITLLVHKFASIWYLNESEFYEKNKLCEICEFCEKMWILWEIWILWKNETFVKKWEFYGEMGILWKMWISGKMWFLWKNVTFVKMKMIFAKRLIFKIWILLKMWFWKWWISWKMWIWTY